MFPKLFSFVLLFCLSQSALAQSAIYKWGIPSASNFFHLKTGNKEVLVGMHMSVMGNDFPMPFIGEVKGDKVELKTWRNSTYLNLQFAKVLPNGNIAIAGTAPENAGNKLGDKDVFYSLFDKDLNLIQSKQITKPGRDILYDLGVTPNNEIILHYCNSFNNSPCLKTSTKIGVDGNVLWTTEVLSSGTWGVAKTLKDGGQLVMNNGNIIIAKLSKDGDLLWSKSLDFRQFYAAHAAEHASGDIYVCLEKVYDSPNHDFVVVKFDANGNYNGITSKALTTSRVLGVIPTLIGVNVFYNSNIPGGLGTFKVIYDQKLANNGAFFTYYDSSESYLSFSQGTANFGQISFSSSANVFSITTSPSEEGLPKCNNRTILFPKGFIKPAVTNTILNPKKISVNTVDIAHQYYQVFNYTAQVHCLVCDTLAKGKKYDLLKCGDSLAIEASNAKYYKWSTSDKGSRVSITKSGTYFLKRFNDRLEEFDTFAVTLNPIPKLSISVNPIEPVPEERVVFKAIPVRSKASYQWKFGTQTSNQDSLIVPTIGIGKHKVYLKVIDSNGCKASDSIEVISSSFKVWFPNVFSPDGNGTNDTFGPEGIGIESFELTVYNRWGEKVYSGKEHWDGKSKGKTLPNGVFVYTCTVRDLFGQPYSYKGNVTILH